MRGRLKIDMTIENYSKRFLREAIITPSNRIKRIYSVFNSHKHQIVKAFHISIRQGIAEMQEIVEEVDPLVTLQVVDAELGTGGLLLYGIHFARIDPKKRPMRVTVTISEKRVDKYSIIEDIDEFFREILKYLEHEFIHNDQFLRMSVEKAIKNANKYSASKDVLEEEREQALSLGDMNKVEQIDILIDRNYLKYEKEIMAQANATAYELLMNNMYPIKVALQRLRQGNIKENESEIFYRYVKFFKNDSPSIYKKYIKYVYQYLKDLESNKRTEETTYIKPYKPIYEIEE